MTWLRSLSVALLGRFGRRLRFPHLLLLTGLLLVIDLLAHTEKWVRERMVPVFPLGVKKDVAEVEPFPTAEPPSFDTSTTQ